MSSETVSRTWKIGSWLVGRADIAAVGNVIAALDADAVAVQSITREDVERLADRLGVRHAWEPSHHPMSRLLPGSAVGLAVLTRHSIGDSASVVANNHSSVWSRQRRIAHFAVIDRSDHTGYTIGHAVGIPDPESRGAPPAPLVWFRPDQIGVDDIRAVDVPDAATIMDAQTAEPVAGASRLFVVTFEMPWVQDGHSVD